MIFICLQIPSNFTQSVLGAGATEEKGENARLVSDHFWIPIQTSLGECVLERHVVFCSFEEVKIIYWLDFWIVRIYISSQN